MRSFNRAVAVIAAALGGLLAVQVGNRPALVVAAAVFGLAALILVASPFRHVKDVPGRTDP